jgi:hypothetical protein
VLEHLPNLPACIREAYRLLNKDAGQMLVVIPCEGSPAYSLARKISAERVYNRHFKGGYTWLISREHINRPHEILAELDPYFTSRRRSSSRSRSCPSFSTISASAFRSAAAGPARPVAGGLP